MDAVAAPAGLLRTFLGDLQITFVPDGYRISRPVTDYPTTTPDFWTSQSEYLDQSGYLVMSLGALLVESPDHKVLIDCGFGSKKTRVAKGPDGPIVSESLPDDEFDSEMVGGTLLENLRHLGVAPEEIEAVAYSHLHGDHTGWLCDANGHAVFPNATHCMDGAEWEYWTATQRRGSPNEAMVGVWKRTLELTSGAQHLFPFLQVMPTAGHTPGHSCHILTSGTERMLVVGDAMHCPAEIVRPEIDFAFDWDDEKARAARVEIARELTQPNTTVAAVHFPKVFGRLVDGPESARVEFDVATEL